VIVTVEKPANYVVIKANVPRVALSEPRPLHCHGNEDGLGILRIRAPFGLGSIWYEYSETE
jgi:hypothetical protein